MNPAKPRPGIRRFVTPGQLAICLVLFFLTWVEVQFPEHKRVFQSDGDRPTKQGTPEVTWTSFIRQSGLQVARGKCEFAASLAEVLEDEEKYISGAPLLWLLPVAAISGIVVGVAMAKSKPRRFTLIACGVLVLASAGGQAALDFPLKTKIDEELEAIASGQAD